MLQQVSMRQLIDKSVNFESARQRATGILMDLLAPCQCDLCGMASNREVDLCIPCEGELPWLERCCRQCAIPLAGGGPLCGNCITQPPVFDRSIAACSYAEPISGWVHAGKYRGDVSRLAILVELLSRCVLATMEVRPAPDLVLPMPLHWRRRWRRGFNQAEFVARRLAGHPRLGNYPLRIDNRLCKRVTATPPQRGQDARERHRNLRGAFRCTRQLSGETVAIVDDVVTTGASAGELASTLKAAGAGRVEVWCCARTLD
jgi:ComF family protein